MVDQDANDGEIYLPLDSHDDHDETIDVVITNGSYNNNSSSSNSNRRHIACENTKSFRQRLREEQQLFYRQRYKIFGCLLLLVYGALVVFRNLAYYRYAFYENNYLVRMVDIGYDIFPEVSGQYLKFSDIPMHIMYAVDGIVVFGAFLGRKHVMAIRERLGISDKFVPVESVTHPHFVNLMLRVLVTYAIGHSLRACTYLATTIPGSSSKCLNATLVDPPKTLGECFYRLSNVNGNCGDLIFSGHILYLMLSFGMIHRYGAACWNFPRFGKVHVGMLATVLVLTVVQICFILMARHHYTVDIMVALYTVPMMWYIYNDQFPDDMEVDGDMLQMQIETERRRSPLSRCLYTFQIVVGLACLMFLTLLVIIGNFNMILKL